MISWVGYRTDAAWIAAHAQFRTTKREHIMSENQLQRDQIDGAKINVHETRDIAYWTKEFGISEEKLVAAVMVAGVSVRSIRHHLARKP